MAAFSIAAGNSHAEENLAGPPEQQAFCSKIFSYNQAVADYQANKAKLGPIQQAQMGPPPTRQKYNDEVVKLLGTSGEFHKWIGLVNVTVVEGNKAAVGLELECKGTGPSGTELFNYGFTNFFLGQGMTPLAQNAVKHGYFAQPFTDPVVMAISKFPNDNKPHYGKLSGSLFYTKDRSGKSGYLNITGYNVADITNQEVYAAKFSEFETP
jgi:hypothetical protein